MALLDKEVIDEVCDALGRDAFVSFANRMLDELQGDLAIFDQLLAAGNLVELARAAHRAAGSAVSVGANGLHDALKLIEGAAADQSAAPKLASFLGQLPALITETRSAIFADLSAV